MNKPIRYYFKLRCPAPGCQPKNGLIETSDKDIEIRGYKFYGYADYDRILTDEEMSQYDIYTEFEISDWEYEAKKAKIKNIISRLRDAVKIGNDNKYVIVHKSTRPEYKWQISYFDAKGPWTHENYNQKIEIINELAMDCLNLDIVEFAN